MDNVRLNMQNYDSNLSIQPARSINGTPIYLDWINSLIARGLTWHTQVGTLITPVVGGGNGTVIVIARPELMISCPIGYALIPYFAAIECKISLLATDNDVIEASIAGDFTQKWDGTGTGTTKSPTNNRSDITAGCPATARSSFTADITSAPVASAEFARMILTGDVQGSAANGMWTRPELVWAPKHPPILMGPAMLILHYGGTVATSAYVQLDFAMIPSALLTSLT